MATKAKTRCKHYHTEAYHPNCFPKYWYDFENENIGYLDIESDGLDANGGFMLCWAIRNRDTKQTVTDFVTPYEIHPNGNIEIVDPKYDYRLVKDLVAELWNYTGIMTYYGTGFDIKYIRSKAMKYGIKFPEYGKIGHVDLYYAVRNRMKLSRNSLAVSTEYLDIPGKTHLDYKYWRLAALGDASAMKKLLNHNVKDVEILQKLHKQLEPYCKFVRNSI